MEDGLLTTWLRTGRRATSSSAPSRWSSACSERGSRCSSLSQLVKDEAILVGNLLRKAIHELSGLFGPFFTFSIFACLLRCFFPVLFPVTPALDAIVEVAFGALPEAFFS